MLVLCRLCRTDEESVRHRSVERAGRRAACLSSYCCESSEGCRVRTGGLASRPLHTYNEHIEPRRDSRERRARCVIGRLPTAVQSSTVRVDYCYEVALLRSLSRLLAAGRGRGALRRGREVLPSATREAEGEKQATPLLRHSSEVDVAARSRHCALPHGAGGVYTMHAERPRRRNCLLLREVVLEVDVAARVDSRHLRGNGGVRGRRQLRSGWAAHELSCHALAASG